MLEYSILQRAAFTVITGRIGSGKTTLAAKILDQIEEKVNVAHLTFVLGHGFDLGLGALRIRTNFQSSNKIELYDRLKKGIWRSFN